MAVYAIGDVQGCFTALRALLERIQFDPDKDRVWFTGDLVNRGPASLEVLRFVKRLGASAITVLGNHDLHLLAVAAGDAKRRARDSFDDVLNAPDRHELLAWLRARPLLHYDSTLDYAMVHGGLLPAWNLGDAQRLAREAESVLTKNAEQFFPHMYGNLPDHWHDDLRAPERLRVIVNAFTRMRYCDRDGKMDLHHNGAPGTQPPHLLPWFQVPGRRSADVRVVFGHWSALGVYQEHNVLALDSGCVWGRALTAARIDGGPAKIFSVPCEPTTSGSE